jgi:hypothetical protein
MPRSLVTGTFVVTVYGSVKRSRVSGSHGCVDCSGGPSTVAGGAYGCRWLPEPTGSGSRLGKGELVMAIRVGWAETFEADVELDRLVELFQEHVPGKVAELLGEYLADNGPTDSDLWPILRTIREEAVRNGEDVTTDVNAVTCEEVN